MISLILLSLFFGSLSFQAACPESRDSIAVKDTIGQGSRADTLQTTRQLSDSLNHVPDSSKRADSEINFWETISRLDTILGILGVSLLLLLSPLVKRVRIWHNFSYSSFFKTLRRKYSVYESFDDLMIMEESQKEQGGHPKAINAALALRDNTSIQILGKPGAGKTTWLFKLLSITAMEESSNSKPRIPVYVEFRGDDLFLQILHFLHINNLAKDISYLTEEWLKNQLSKGRFIVLIDDVHKVIGTTDWKSASRIANLLEYSQNRFVLMSRDYFKRNEFGVRIYSVSPLDESQMKKILLVHTGDHNTEIILQELRWNRHLNSLYDTPQMLSFLARLYEKHERIPSNKARAFSQIWNDISTGETIKGSPLPRHLQDQLLSNLAITMLSNRTPFWIGHSELLGVLNTKLGALTLQQGYSSFDAPNVLNEFLKIGMLISEDDGIRFRHDQWQEYFAALEIFETRIPLKQVMPFGSFRELMYFVAGMHNPDGTEAEKAYFNEFLDELVQTDFFLFGYCLKATYDENQTIQEAHDYYSDVVVTGQDVRRLYGRFLEYYCKLIDVHFPKLKDRFEPETEGEIGVVVEKSTSRWSYFYAFVPRKLAGHDGVMLLDREDATKEIGTLDENMILGHYANKFSTWGFKAIDPDPVLYESPIVGAYNDIQHQLKDLIRGKGLVDPVEVLQERIFYEGKALGKRHKDFESGFTVKQLTDLLRKMRINESIWPRFIRGKTVDTQALNEEVNRLFLEGFDPKRGKGSTTYGGIYRRNINPADIEKALNSFISRSHVNDTDFILPPMQEIPRKYWMHTKEELTEIDRQKMIEWSSKFYRKLYASYKELLEVNFPTSKSAFGTYKRFPLVVALVADEERFKKQRYLGERYVFGNVDSLTADVEIKVFTKADFDPYQKEMRRSGWFRSIWALPRDHSTEPLREAVYKMVLDEYERLVRNSWDF